MIELIAIGCLLLVVIILTFIERGQTSREHGQMLWAISHAKDESTKQLVEAVIQGFIARNAHEAVEAKGLKDRWDIANQNLADAYAEVAAESAKREPKWATTADGKQIDLNEYELL